MDFFLSSQITGTERNYLNAFDSNFMVKFKTRVKSFLNTVPDVIGVDDLVHPLLQFRATHKLTTVAID